MTARSEETSVEQAMPETADKSILELFSLILQQLKSFSKQLELLEKRIKALEDKLEP
ncbi:MAG: hypothetical protein ACE5OZ_07425 [Candidatus Heimdallarchaeota archaeon]